MTLSLRDDIALLTDEKKGFRPKNKEVAPKDFTERYSNDGVSDKFDSEYCRFILDGKLLYGLFEILGDSCRISQNY